MKRGWLVGSAVLVAALLFFGGLRPTRQAESTPPTSDKAATSSQGVESATAPPAIPVPSEEPLQSAAGPGDPTSTTLTELRKRYARSSLRGTHPDGEIALDPFGQLQLDAGLVHRFEHFLSLIGEFGLADIRDLLQAQLQDEFGDAVAAQAIDAFDRYLALREEIAATELADDLGVRLEQLRALRREHFGAAADTMFGAEEAEIAYSIARREVLRDASMSSAERSAALAALDAARDPQQRALQRDATAPQLVDEQTRQFDVLNTDPATRNAERSALWGDEAAQRLAALDTERAAWDARVAAYQFERDRLLARPDLSQAARQRQIDTLRAGRFDGVERQRIEALEAVGALPPGG